MDRKKLELDLNMPTILEIIFEAKIGQNGYGEYYLYVVKNEANTEFSFFAPKEVHEQIKDLKKGDKFQITKLAKQNGKKLQIDYDVKILSNKTAPDKPSQNGSKDSYFEIMVQSYEDSIKIQEKLNGMVDVNRIAITLFIARSKINSNNFN
jgi:hypothetical protein